MAGCQRCESRTFSGERQISSATDERLETKDVPWLLTHIHLFVSLDGYNDRKSGVYLDGSGDPLSNDTIIDPINSLVLWSLGSRFKYDRYESLAEDE